MTRLDEVGASDGWRCWLCDEPVDPDASVNDDRGPSVDSRITKAKSKRGGPSTAERRTNERLAHRGCNTKKGAVTAVVPWPRDLIVGDPAAIIASVERLGRKGGREVMGRCSTESDAESAGRWLVDRISRLEPTLDLAARIETGGGQFLIILEA